MSTRILILTAGFGEGHNAAARALAQACDAAGGVGTARTADVFAAVAPRWNGLMRGAYIALVNRAPRVWSRAYGWMDRSTLAPRLLTLLRRETRGLARIIAGYRPDVIASTYPVYGFLMAGIARRGAAGARPFFTVVTDSITINSLWWRAPAEGWFVPNEDSAEVLRAAGVRGARVHALGFPVDLRFADPRLAPPDLAQNAVPRILYIINSRRAAAAETARRLLLDSPWEVTCAVGRNAPLRDELQRIAARRRQPTRILGWTDEIPRLLMTHHLVISKAGGATTQEALAARCPMLVNQIIPGQEEGNYELLRRHGVGAFADTPAAVLAGIERAFARRGAVWNQWRRNLAPLSRPHAAQEIATRLLASAAAPPADSSAVRRARPRATAA